MLVQEDVDWLISRWPPPEMSVWRSMLASGSSLFGIFEGQALIGFSIYRPDLSPDTAQLAALYVSNPYRRRKAGGMLLDKVAENLMHEHDPEEACRTVFGVLEERMTGGEIEDVKRILPAPIRDLWP